MNIEDKIVAKDGISEDDDGISSSSSSIQANTNTCDDNVSNSSIGMDAKDFEIDEVMEFMRFSVKPSSTFEGTIVFRFKHDDKPKDTTTKKDATIYAVNVDGSREVTTEKNGEALPKKIVCEVGISVDDFLWIYSGKASASDVVKLYYSGRLAVSAFALRQLSTFASSFDYSPEKWKEFYAWREKQEQAAMMKFKSIKVIQDKNKMDTISRDFWLHNSHLILTQYKISKLQRMQWEISLASMFGEHFVLGRVLDAVGLYGRKFFCTSTNKQVKNVEKTIRKRNKMIGSAEEMEKLVFHLVHEVTSCRQVAKTHLRCMQHQQLSQIPTGNSTCNTCITMKDVEKCSIKNDYLYPSEEILNNLIESLNLSQRDVDMMEVFDFVDDKYVDAVKLSSKERIRKIQVKNRIDLADAGMKQLDRFLQQVVQKLEPINTFSSSSSSSSSSSCSGKKRKAKSKYIPAPELFLREIRRQAMEIIEMVQEKALGRKSVQKIPTPNVEWAFDTSKTLIRLQPIDNNNNHTSSACGSSSSSSFFLNDQQKQTRMSFIESEDTLVTGVDQFVLPRRHLYTTSGPPKKREFAKTQKLAIKRTLNSIQREFNARNDSIDAFQMAEENWMFSDYA